MGDDVIQQLLHRLLNRLQIERTDQGKQVAVFLIHLCDANLEALTPFDYVRGFALDGFFAHRVFPLPKKRQFALPGRRTQRYRLMRRGRLVEHRQNSSEQRCIGKANAGPFPQAKCISLIYVRKFWECEGAPPCARLESVELTPGTAFSRVSVKLHRPRAQACHPPTDS